MMDEPRIRAAAADDVAAITEIVDRAYRHYIARIGKPAHARQEKSGYDRRTPRESVYKFMKLFVGKGRRAKVSQLWLSLPTVASH